MTTDTLPTPPTVDPADWRIVVTQDQSPDDPNGWGNVVVIPLGRYTGRNGGADAVGDDDLDLAAALERFREGIPADYARHTRGAARHSYSPDASADTAMRWARIFHRVTVVYDDRADALYYLPKSTRAEYERGDYAAHTAEHWGGSLDAAMRANLEGWVDTWRQWADGEVYVIALERRVTWHRDELADVPADAPRTRQTWETVDSIGGVYLEGPADVRSTVRDYFTLPDGLDLDAVEVVDA